MSTRCGSCVFLGYSGTVALGVGKISSDVGVRRVPVAAGGDRGRVRGYLLWRVWRRDIERQTRSGDISVYRYQRPTLPLCP